MSERIGRAVQSYRRARGLTQEELAARAATCVGTVSLIERGRTNANRHTLLRIARALRVKVRELEQFEAERTEGESSAA